MEKHLWMCFCSMFALASCQQEEMSMSQQGTLDLHVQASIAGNEMSARSVTAEDGSSDFKEGDEIGFFMPYSSTPMKWTLASGSWKTDGEAEWKDKVNEYSFCAYYPYAKETTSSAQVVMPDLSKQTGTWNGLGEYDFLFARCLASYESNNGTVSFTGPSAFQHAYSLVSVTLIKDKEGEEVTLQKESFSGEGFFDKHYYKFDDKASLDGMVAVGESSASPLTFTYEEGVALDIKGSHSAVILLNPSVSEKTLSYSAAYQRDGISYIAHTDGIKGEFKSGYCYKYKLRLTKEGLAVVGKEISQWNVESMEDILIEETPDNQQ